MADALVGRELCTADVNFALMPHPVTTLLASQQVFPRPSLVASSDLQDHSEALHLDLTCLDSQRR